MTVCVAGSSTNPSVAKESFLSTSVRVKLLPAMEGLIHTSHDFLRSSPVAFAWKVMSFLQVRGIAAHTENSPEIEFVASSLATSTPTVTVVVGDLDKITVAS